MVLCFSLKFLEKKGLTKGRNESFSILSVPSNSGTSSHPQALTRSNKPKGGTHLNIFVSYVPTYFGFPNVIVLTLTSWQHLNIMQNEYMKDTYLN